MTTIHMDTQPQAANGSSLGQSQSPNKFDEIERVRQRMDGLRKHHNESTDIYNRTQPIINEQIHEETMKYLKNGQVNGTKTKSQKPRAPKRQRNTSSNNSNNSTTNSTPQSIVQQPGHLQQSPLYPPQPIQQQPMQQITLYPPRIQQQPMHLPSHQQHPHQMQPQPQQQPPPPPQQQQQQHFKYQTTSNMYQQSHQTNMQAQHQYQAPPPQQKQQQQIYPQQQQMQPSTHVHPQQIEQSHFVSQQRGTSHLPLTSLPNDLDLTLQAGLECDIDSLIKHEMSVEGQLDFNHDLLLKLDNHYQY